MNTISYRVINCKKHKDRLAKFEEHALAAGISVSRVACADGSKLNAQSICQMRAQKLLAPRVKDLTPVHVAIFLSHIKCWRALVRSKKTYMCVFEDDARVHPHFSTCLAAIMERAPELRFDILHLSNGNWMYTKSKQERVATVKCAIEGASSPLYIMKETVEYNAGASSYVIHRDFAAFMLNRAHPIGTEVDLFIGYDSLPRSKRHLTLQTYKDEDGCWTKSPLVDIDCPWEGDSVGRTNHSPIVTKTVRCPRS